MPKNFTKGTYVIIGLFIFEVFVSCNFHKQKDTQQDHSRVAFVALEQQYLQDLKHCITSLDTLVMNTTIPQLERCFLEARRHFKAIEPIISFVDSENYKFLNQPNILKVEEEDYTDIKIKQPQGFQVLEETIFTETVNIETVKMHAKAISSRLRLLQKNTRLTYLKRHHFLWIMRNAIVRVALTGITGFDSPVLENSLAESTAVYQSLKHYLSFFEVNFENAKLFTEWNTMLDNTIAQFQGDFVNFDRYRFIKNHTQPILQLWTRTVADWKVVFPFHQALRNDATSLFSEHTFNLSYFSSESFGTLDTEKVRLGALLFQEKSMSKTGTMSCASCHQAALQYTDGQKIAKGATRNSPTLLYAALQKGLFYDRSAGSLEGQIVSVVTNENEFHSDLESMKAAIAANPVFNTAFKKLYRDSVSEQNIRNAIATFVRSLTPFNSKFDRNINGLEMTMTDSEIHGFNVFSGKGKCATCHFAPVFNGTVPPLFQESELERIGVPQNKDTINAQLSSDLGRFNVYQTPERKHFFKTPTVRNSSKTAPYMHNGVYTTLQEVVTFYNRGGGAGLGIDATHQTLPPDPLNLSIQEQKDLIAFLKTLADPSDEY